MWVFSRVSLPRLPLESALPSLPRLRIACSTPCCLRIYCCKALVIIDLAQVCVLLLANQHHPLKIVDNFVSLFWDSSLKSEYELRNAMAYKQMRYILSTFLRPRFIANQDTYTPHLIIYHHLTSKHCKFPTISLQSPSSSP